LNIVFFIYKGFIFLTSKKALICSQSINTSSTLCGCSKLLRCCLVMWLRVRFMQSYIWIFGNKEKSDFYWWDPPILTVAPQVCFSLWFPLNSGAWLHCCTIHANSASHCSREQLLFFFLKISAVNLFHSHCSREHEFLIFFCFFFKISLRWIKFTRTVISILFLLICYLILLHAQKIMKTVVLVE